GFLFRAQQSDRQIFQSPFRARLDDARRRHHSSSTMRGHSATCEGSGSRSQPTNMSKRDPVIVVTGGNRGIGFEICRQLAARGAQVVLTGRKSRAGQVAVNKLGSQKLATQFHQLNVTKAESISALSDFLKRTFGRLGVLINNAGIISDE